jgi:hypothetical protein
MRIINSLSKKFQKKCDITTCDEKQLHRILPDWFAEIDVIYFSSEKDTIQINLDDYDKQLILKSADCFDKLKSLSFKKNIHILNFNKLTSKSN